MSTRQYIGARYVPVIYQNSQDASSSAWEAGVTYEPLTMVTFGNANYISRKLVPPSAGNPGIESTYWAYMGAGSAQIAQIQTDLNNLTEEVEDISSSLAGAFWTLDSMKEKTVILIGDSWGNTQTSLGATNNWIDLITPYFKTVYRGALNGYSFNKTGASYITIIDGIQTQGEKIDAVITIGGANGAAAGDVTAYVNRVKELYPDAEIVIGINGPCLPKTTCWRIQEMGEAEAARLGCKIIKGLWLTTAKSDISNWTADHFHLLNYTEFVENLIAYLTSGQYTHHYNANRVGSQFTWTDSNMAAYFKDIGFSAYKRCGNKVTFAYTANKGTNFNAASDSITLTYGNNYDLGYFPVTMAFSDYVNSQSGVTNHGFILQRFDKYDLYISTPDGDIYPHLYFVPRENGTFTKAQLFTESRPLQVAINTELFDWQAPVRANENSLPGMISFCNDHMF